VKRLLFGVVRERVLVIVAEPQNAVGELVDGGLHVETTCCWGTICRLSTAANCASR
jgi:hypothetical protein